MDASLADLVQQGLPNARIVFGSGSAPVVACRVAEAGAGLYADHAPAPAVGAVLTNDRGTVEVVLGAVARGATLVSLPLPGRAGDLDDHATLVRRACAANGVAEVVVRDDVADLLDGLGVPVRRHSQLHARPLAPPGDQFRLIQFTSGSTTHPRAIELGDTALGANVSAILDRVGPQPGDTAVSWLPLSHDMGLIGMLLASLTATGPRWAGGGDIVLMEPAEFMRRPAVWLEALDRYRGSFTAAPDFAYRMVTQRPPRGSLDLSSVRCAIVGGEIVRHDTLAEFTARFGGHGLDKTAVCPAYGLAELGLAATLTDPGSIWCTRTVAVAALADDRLDPPRAGDSAVTVVASGSPLTGYQIRCGQGAPADGGRPRAGEIEVCGPSVGADAATGVSCAGQEDWLHTGDVGFVDGGQLYVCGRNDDYVVANGRKLYAPAIEAAVGGVPGVRPGRVCAVMLPGGGWVVAAEAADATSIERRVLREGIRRVATQTGTASPDDVVVLARGTLPFTASGKLRRNEVRRRLLRGDLDTTLPSPGTTPG